MGAINRPQNLSTGQVNMSYESLDFNFCPHRHISPTWLEERLVGYSGCFFLTPVFEIIYWLQTVVVKHCLMWFIFVINLTKIFRLILNITKKNNCCHSRSNIGPQTARLFPVPPGLHKHQNPAVVPTCTVWQLSNNSFSKTKNCL